MYLTGSIRASAMAFLAAMALSTGAWGQCQYEVAIIQAPESPPFGFPPTVGVGLNDDGKVVGYYASGVVGPDRPFIWTPQGGFQSMPLPPGAYEARFNDINNAGQICGTMTIADVGYRGFFYSGGQYTELPPMPGGAWSTANALNDAGQVVGYRSVGTGVNPYNAFIWSAAEGFTDLGVMNGPNSSAMDISAAGIVVGWDGSSVIHGQAVKWIEGQPVPLITSPEYPESNARAVARSGPVAGTVSLSGSSLMRAYRLADDALVILNPLPGYDNSAGLAINDISEVVGLCSQSEIPNDHAGFLWNAGVMQALNDVIPPGTPIHIEGGRCVNRMGQIVATGTGPAGAAVTFLLTAIDRSITDLNGDCETDVDDVLILLGQWGRTYSAADFNGDETVDVLDLLRLLADWG